MESPNIEYIEKLSKGDIIVKKMLIDVIKTEFLEEKEKYFENFRKRKLKDIEENVHKLKHKISILGLKDGHNFADLYEQNLRKKSTHGYEDFEKTLVTMSDFIETL